MGLSLVGTGAAVWLVVAFALALHRRRPQIVLVVAVTWLATVGANTALKYLVQRDRPPSVILDPEPLMEVPTTSSFPSGHTSTAFALALTLSRFATRLRLPLVVLAALIGLSRVYVGVHYPLDVLAGALLGLLVATALPRLLGALRRSLQARRAG